jgi:hypothetical protein
MRILISREGEGGMKAGTQTSPRTKPRPERNGENINDMTQSLLIVYKTGHRTASKHGHMVT